MQWRTGLMIIMILLAVTETASAAVRPAADTSATIRNRQVRPGGEITAKVQLEPVELPAKPWKIPGGPLMMYGQGISLFYMVPFERVKALLPKEVLPFPGPNRIWFRVDVLQWKTIHVKDKPLVKIKKFVELAYRFEVIKDGKRCLWPVKLYADTAWPVLWLRQYTDYPAYLLPTADVNFSPFSHFYQFKKGVVAVAVVDVAPKQGVGAQMNGLFSKKNDFLLWQGSGAEWVLPIHTQGSGVMVNRFMQAEHQNAEIKMLLLDDPVKWKILTRDEMQQPDKTLILDNIRTVWLEGMEDRFAAEAATNAENAPAGKGTDREPPADPSSEE